MAVRLAERKIVKIIKEGKKDWKPWWVGKLMQCNDCGRVIELEKDDYVTKIPSGICSTCEKCGNSISLKSQ
jgi:hypothetical protein